MRQRSLSASGVAECGDGDVRDDEVVVRSGGRGRLIGGEGGLQRQIRTQLVGRLSTQPGHPCATSTELVGRLSAQPAWSQRNAEPVEPTQSAPGDELQQLVWYVSVRVVRHVEPGQLP